MTDMTPDFAIPQRDKPDGTLPRFHMKAVKNEFRSAAEGRPIFDNMEYVEIHIPGDRMTQVDRRVKPEDRTRWPEAYAAFKEERAQVADGLPLETWAGLDRAQVEELKHFRIHTVEQLAGLSDEQVTNIGMGGRALRDAASRFLQTMEGAAPTEKLAAEVASKDAMIADLKEQLAEAHKLIGELRSGANAGA